VGFDDKTSLGRNETGSRAALPIWISFMERALRETPGESFKVPEGITLLKVDLETGLPPNAHSKDIIPEAFLDGNPPQSVERESTRKEGSFSDPAARGGLPPSRAQGP
jgi:penicillin-binding protein 1A